MIQSLMKKSNNKKLFLYLHTQVSKSTERVLGKLHTKLITTVTSGIGEEEERYLCSDHIYALILYIIPIA